MSCTAHANTAPQNSSNLWVVGGLTVPQGMVPSTFFDPPKGIFTGQSIFETQELNPISVLELGGTIASKPSPDGKVPALSLREIIEQAFGPDVVKLPELFVAPMGSRCYHFGQGMDSSAMGPEEAMRVVDRLYYHSQVAEGVLVTCGTDRMADMALATDLMLCHPPVPIVFTGAQCTLSDKPNDVRTNIADSLFALKKLPPGVYIIFNHRIISAECAMKFSTENLDAFRSVNRDDFGYVNAARDIYHSQNLPSTVASFPLDTRREFTHAKYQFDPAVEVIELSFGYREEALKKQLERSDIHGVIIKAPGTGGIKESYAKVMQEFAHKKPIVVVTRWYP